LENNVIRFFSLYTIFVLYCVSWAVPEREHSYHKWERLRPSSVRKLCAEYLNTLVVKVRMKESKRKEGNDRQEIENMRCYGKVFRLGKKRNAFLTYSILAATPFKIVSL
jgi:hypothetical protein